MLLDPTNEGSGRISRPNVRNFANRSTVTDLRETLIRNDRVVLSIDLSKTFSFPDRLSCACFRGLNVRTVEMILFEIVCRDRTSKDRQFRVASTRSALLAPSQSLIAPMWTANLPLFFIEHVQ